MKKLFFSFVLFLAVIMIGCQENSVTGPNPAGSGLKANTGSQAQTSGTISLDGILKVPGSSNTYYTVKGAAEYNEQPASPLSSSSPGSFDIRLSLSAEGTINTSSAPGYGTEHNQWYFSGKSQDQINAASIDGKYSILKLYPIMGRTDGLVLVCKYSVTTSSVQLEGKWLLFYVENTNVSSKTF